jgi:nucleoside-diphosphate-sugar epimerase
MSSPKTVLLLGGTGRTGARVLTQLLERGVSVRALVRSAARLPEGVATHPLLSVTETDVLSLTDAETGRHLDGCDAAISCLGHPNDVRGIFGPPNDIVVHMVRSVVRAARSLAPARPVRLIVMSSVSVNRPGRADTVRGTFERSVVAVLRALVPPARDNQRAADFLAEEVGATDPAVEWVVVRPDSLLEGDVCEYELHEALITTLAKPDATNRASVAHFMCELATDDAAWQRWRGGMPVAVNATE